MPEPTGEHELQTAVGHFRAGRIAEAEAACTRVRPEHPRYVDSLALLAVMANKAERRGEAVRLLEKAVSLSPERADLWLQLALVQRSSGDYQLAIASLERATSLKRDDAQIHFTLGNTFQLTGNYDRSIECYNRALELAPTLVDALSNLGSAFRKIGDLDQAIYCYRRAQELKPESVITHDNLLLALLYHPGSTAQLMFDEYRRWNRMHAEPLPKFHHPRLGPADAGRKLRIGYLSPDFGDHPVGRFMLPLLTHHDRARFEIFCFSQNRSPDQVTAELRSHADAWREIFDLKDKEAADQIRQDRIDILINLALHTAKNRLLVFARKPAPVQVIYLGYAGGCAAECVDYRLTDKYIDPDESQEQFYFQKRRQLHGSYWCYQPPASRVPVGPLPALRSGGSLMLGCLNNFSKVTRPSLELWAQLLRRLATARLLLHAPEGSPRRQVLKTLIENQITPDRVEFVDRLDFDAYLQNYHRIDIALDPMPFAGGTTTCDALWMGVPVVTLAGATAVSRAGVSILTNAGFPEWIADSPQQYINIVADLAGDLSRLSTIRSGLRKTLSASALMDAVGFARSVEAAFCGMWRDWCDSG